MGVLRSRSRRTWAIAAAVLGAAVVAIVLIATAGSPDTPYGDRGTADDGGSGPPRGQVSRFGETVRLRTYLTVIEVRTLGFTRVPASQASGPGVGVDLAIRNVGRAPYRDQPLQAASVLLRRGEEAERVYLPVGSCGGPPEDTIRIPTGATARFCLPFEATGRPDLFVYSPEDGLPGARGAPETAAWAFPR